MYPVVSWPLSSSIRKRPFRSDSVTSPSTSTFSSFTLMSPPLLDQHYAGCLGALLALASLVCDLGALGQALEALAGDLAEMDEQVLTALVGLDKPVALLVVEPLHSSGCHQTPPSTSHERVRKAKRATVERPKPNGRVSGRANPGWKYAFGGTLPRAP